MQIKILELFGGIGAPRKALENIHVQVKSIDYVEIDKHAVYCYNYLYNHLKTPESVVGFDLRPDILIHGSPCQDFSVAGFQKGGAPDSDTRSSLMWETIKIVKDLTNNRPKVVIWENVKGVLNKNNIDTFNLYIEELNKLGYTSNYKILNALDFGTPQKRERVFTVSILNGDKFNFDNLETKEMEDINVYLEDLTTANYVDKYYIHQPSMLKAIEEKKIKEIKDYCYTITTKQMRWNNAGYVKDSRGIRILTPQECWRLMGFEDGDYNKIALNLTDTQLYKLAGNSIVVQVLESIFKELLKSGVLKEEGNER